MKTIGATKPADFTLAVRINSGKLYEWSEVLLARASPDGVFELLTSGWGKLLGYGREEFSGKTLRQLMPPGEMPAGTVTAILDHENMEPVDVTLRCRYGRPKRLRLHRRFDEYGQKMFIVAEEKPRARARRCRGE
jgi:PAS domain-containing protein